MISNLVKSGTSEISIAMSELNFTFPELFRNSNDTSKLTDPIPELNTAV